MRREYTPLHTLHTYLDIYRMPDKKDRRERERKRK